MLLRRPRFSRPSWANKERGLAGARPELIVLEVTENLLIDDVEQAAARMRELAAMGLRFSIDDFGTGF
ncbi:MAG: EAL domain-containing protein, partial [Mesorhizobium sp.]|nr:EAL domain-containing protein [Mesorhizobium sp.]